jgi:hypothetical protein
MLPQHAFHCEFVADHNADLTVIDALRDITIPLDD